MLAVQTEHDFERGVSVLRKQIDAKVASYFSSCVHCGLCAEACLFYTETGDPRYTPIYKVEPMRRSVAARTHLLRQARQGAGVRQEPDGGRLRRLAGDDLRQLHPVRALLHGLPGGQRHRLHDPQAAGGLCRVRLLARGAPGCHHPRPGDRQPHGRDPEGAVGADRPCGACHWPHRSLGQAGRRLHGAPLLHGGHQLPGVHREPDAHLRRRRCELDPRPARPSRPPTAASRSATPPSPRSW